MLIISSYQLNAKNFFQLLLSKPYKWIIDHWLQRVIPFTVTKSKPLFNAAARGMGKPLLG